MQYVWPDLNHTEAFIGKGMNTFRINILAERGVVGKDQKGPFAEAYIQDLKTVRRIRHILPIDSYILDCKILHRQGTICHDLPAQLRPLVRRNHHRC
jgi:hypothetical protein